MFTVQLNKVDVHCSTKQGWCSLFNFNKHLVIEIKLLCSSLNFNRFVLRRTSTALFFTELQQIRSAPDFNCFVLRRTSTDSFFTELQQIRSSPDFNRFILSLRPTNAHSKNVLIYNTKWKLYKTKMRNFTKTT